MLEFATCDKSYACTHSCHVCDVVTFCLVCLFIKSILMIAGEQKHRPWSTSEHQFSQACLLLRRGVKTYKRENVAAIVRNCVTYGLDSQRNMGYFFQNKNHVEGLRIEKEKDKGKEENSNQKVGGQENLPYKSRFPTITLMHLCLRFLIFILHSGVFF